VASDSFAEFLRKHLAPLGRVTVRRMFGTTGVFCDTCLSQGKKAQADATTNPTGGKAEDSPTHKRTPNCRSEKCSDPGTFDIFEAQ